MNRIALLITSLLVLTISSCGNLDGNLPLNTQEPQQIIVTQIVKETVIVEVPVTLTPSETNRTIPALELREPEINTIDDAKMVWVPRGGFRMGYEDGEQNERPVHSIFLEGFWIYETEVTNSQYLACVREGDCKMNECGVNINDSSLEDHPVVCVTWQDADTYCKWAGGRLPTEAEWEKAARGKDDRTWPWGSNVVTCQMANFLGCGNYTASVESYLPGMSPYGVLNLAGNVREWVSDWYGEDYYQVSPRNNPTGSDSGAERVLRGGSWASEEDYLRTTFRDSYGPDKATDDIGFRCVQTQ